MKTTLATLLATTALLLAGCATTPKLVHTSSGKPECIIAAPIAAIKAAIIADMANSGYALESDTPYLLRFARSLKGMEAIGVGTGYSTNRRIITYTFLPDQADTKIIVDMQDQAQMPGGQINRQDLSGIARIFNSYMAQLRGIRDQLENKATGHATSI